MRTYLNDFTGDRGKVAEVQLTETEDGFSVEASDLGWPVSMAEWPDRFMLGEEQDVYKMSSRDSNGAIYRHDASGRKIDVIND